MSGLRWFAAIILAAFICGAGAAEAASVQISINKISQKMTVTVDGVEKYVTPGGHAIHGSPHVRSLGTAVSHGCVRLAPDNAATLYALVQKAGMKNTRVTVTGGLDFAFFSRFSAPRISKPKWLQTSWWSSRPSRQPVGRANVAR